MQPINYSVDQHQQVINQPQIINNNHYNMNTNNYNSINNQNQFSNYNNFNNDDDNQYLPIEGLSPYINDWVIKGRVTKKTQIREWNNARGSGCLFSITIMDKAGN
jgi:replication factor A1